MKLEERGHRSFDRVTTPARFTRHTCHTRHTAHADRDPLSEPVPPGRGCSTCGGERKSPGIGGTAECLLAGRTPTVKPECPRARATGLHHQIETGATSIRIFGPHRDA